MRCDDCAYAKWKRTASGRLHPDKTGRCSFEIPIVVLPAAFYWATFSPRPSGGFIDRGRELNRECPTYSKLEA